MQPTQTGIATALALIVVIAFFIVPGLWPFRSSAPGGADQQAATETATTVATQPTTNTQPNNTMSANAIPVKELSFKDEVVGSGAAAAPGDTITVNYVGSLIDGTVFDASANHGSTGFSFTLGAGQVIKGWDQGIVGMKEGGKRALIIPADLAYGDRPVGNLIPANSPLVFEVELLKVQKGSQ